MSEPWVVGVFVVIGAMLGPIAGVMAFLITYEEYQHHGFGRRRLIGASLRAGLVTAIFFFVLTVVVGILVTTWWL